MSDFDTAETRRPADGASQMRFSHRDAPFGRGLAHFVQTAARRLTVPGAVMHLTVGTRTDIPVWDRSIDI